MRGHIHEPALLLCTSQKWLRLNFSLQYPNIIQQTGDKNTQSYQVEVVILI